MISGSVLVGAVGSTAPSVNVSARSGPLAGSPVVPAGSSTAVSPVPSSKAAPGPLVPSADASAASASPSPSPISALARKNTPTPSPVSTTTNTSARPRGLKRGNCRLRDPASCGRRNGRLGL